MRTRWFALLCAFALVATVVLDGAIAPNQASAVGTVTLRSVSTFVAPGATTTFTVAKPAGLAAKDVMVAALSLNAGGAVTAPAGWTLIGHTVNVTVVHLWTYYRVAGASEPTSYTWTSASSAAGVAGIAAYVGVDPVNPLSGSSFATGSTASVTAPAVSISSSSVALLLLTIDGSFAGTVAYPAGFTQRWALVDYERGYVADNLVAATGTLPAATITLSAANFWSVQQVGLRVMGPAPTVTSVTPSGGPSAGGTSVTVAGTGFQTGATVAFGGAALTVSTVTATSITGTTTAHAAGAVNVVVTNPDVQTGTCTGCFTYGAPAPTVTSVTPPSGPSAGGTSATVSGTGFQAGATVSFGGSALSVSTVSATSITGTTTAHAAGAINVVVTNPDAQTGTCAGCFTYVAAPTVSSVTPNSGSSAGGTSVTISGTGFQGGATVSFGGSALTVSTVSATSITGTTTTHAAGAVNVVVTNSDSQSGTCATCFTYLAPGPTVSSVAPSGGSILGGTSVTVSGTGFQSGATASFGGSALTVSTVSATSITGTTTAHVAGAVNVVVTNPDSQSGSCAACFTYVGPPPSITSVTPASGSSLGGTAVTIAGSDFQTGVTVSFGGSALTISTVSPTSITGTTTAHAAGAVSVVATNPDSQSSSCGCFTYVVPAPTVSSVTPNSGSSAGGTSVTVSGTGFQAGATVSFGGAALTVATISATSITGTTTAHAAGAVNLVVTNPDAQTGTCTGCFTYLAPAPTVTSVTPPSGPSAGGTSVTVSGTGFQAGATVSFGGSALTVSTISATSITGTTTAHAAGAVNVVVTNPDTQSGACTGCFTYVAAPTLSTVTPNSGPSAGGTSVSIAGTGFQAGATVSFGGSALTVSTISATSITGTTSAHAAGAINVVVTNPDAQTGTCTGCFTYVAAPTVSSVTPNSGPSAGGTSVSIAGTGFQAGATVSFGGSALTVSTVSATSIAGTTAAHAAGVVNVIVTNPDAQSGTCSGCFTYVAAPTASSVTPASGSSAGGTAVTIIGTGFQAGAAVSFGGSALTISTISGTSITGTTTAHPAGAVDVVVTNPDGQTGTCTGCFSYLGGPTVSSVTPNSGPSTGGTSVTVSGAGFQAGATVSFGGSALTVSTITASSITGTTTSHAAGTVNVVVTNPDAQSGSCASCFTYVAAPTVSSVTPNSGPSAGGTSVSIAGTGFQTGATVSFGGSALTVSTITATTITGTTSAHAAGAVNVVVTNPDAQSGACSSCFTYLAPPTVSMVAPNSGPSGGGTSVSIAGTGFQTGATASFSGSALTVSTITATSISGTTTAHAAGTVSVVVTNPDAQTGSCPGCYSYIAGPTVSSVTPTSGPSAGGTSVTIAGTGFQTGATVSLGGSALTVSTISATSITGTTSAHAAGAVNVVVTNPDAQSGTCSGCFTYVAPPTASSVTPNSGPSAGGSSVTVNGTGFQPGATASFGGSALTVSTVTATTISGTTTAHAAGAVNVVVTNPDAQTGSCASCFTYVAAPTVSSVTPNSGPSAGGTALTVNGSGFQTGATVSLGGSGLTVSTVGPTSITGTTTAHAAGAVNVVVTNPDSQTATCTGCFTYVAAPTVSSVTPNSGPSAGGSSVTVNGTGFQAGATVSLGGSALTVATVSATSVTGTTTAHAPGMVNVTVTNPDAQTGSCSGCFTYVAPPTVSSVTPSNGPAAGGTSVAVNGSGFQAGATVSFGGSALTVSTITATTISGTTTAHAAGAVNVTVNNPDTQAGSCTNCFTYVAAPTATAVAPSSGPAAGGTSVSVAGTGFQAGATVSFGGSSLTVSTISATSITGTTTAHAAGAVNVVVTNPDSQTATCTGCFTYVAAPTAASVAPPSGASAGGTAVTINGTGFQPGATASFGGSALTVSTVTATTISGTTTAHAAGVVSVVVTNPDGQTGTCSSCFTYVAPPTVSSVTPASGPAGGGTAVTVNGTGFQSGATVSFGGSALTVSTVSATSITGNTTAHAAGAVNVVVTNPDAQTGTCGGCFTYLAAPTGITLRGTSTATGSGTTFTVNLPAGVVANDVMVAALSINAGGTVTAPAGWTLIGHTVSVTVVHLWTYYRVAGASESATYTWTTSSSASGVAGIAAYVGVDIASPLNGFSSATDDGSGSSQATAPGVTTSLSSAALLLLTLDGSFTGTVSYPAGFTQRWAVTNYESGYAADNLTTVTGNLPAATISLSAASFWAIQQVALKVGGPAPAPTVASVTPTGGSTGGGTAVTVNGTGFRSGATASFGGSPLAVSTVTGTAITGTTSAHATGTVNVTVTNTDAQSGTCAGCYTYVVPGPPPTVSSVSPNSGPSAGGTSVTVSGTAFQSGATVSFSGAALVVSTVTGTAITGTTSARAAGTVNVTVTNPDAQSGSCTGCYTYVPGPPTVSGVSPSSGSIGGGTSVTVNGTGFQSGATASFGGSALTVSTVTATAITGTTTAHPAGVVNVVVTNPDTQNGTCTGCFSYLSAAPQIVSVTPTSGNSAGGDWVSLNGSGFQGGATVTFGGSSLTISTLSATSITGTTTAHAAGTVSVTIANPDAQQNTCSNCYTYITATGNAVQIENSYLADPTWNDFTSVNTDTAISGYGSQISVNRGSAIDFFVTTTAATFTIDVYRTGWYGGAGARRMAALGSFTGVQQAIPAPNATTGMIACNWTKATTFAVPASWTTGVYLAKLTASNGNKSFIFFVVRNDTGHEDFIAKTSVTTYQAYNNWGGVSLYENKTNKSIYPYVQAVKVSFDRPFQPAEGGLSNGAGHYLLWEYQFVRWAESQGFDLTYITDVDLHTNVNPLANHKGFVSLGHDEYWSRPMRENVQNAVNGGMNAAFFSGNTADWQIRFEASASGVPNRVQVGYKEFATLSTRPGPDPMFGVNNPIVTGQWRQTPVNQPQNALLGVMYEATADKNYAYVVQNASHWVYTGTGFANGSQVPGIVGYEYDKIWNNGLTPAGLTTLSSSSVNGFAGPSTSNSTIYTASSGARVFAAGTIQWNWGLDDYGSDAFGGNTGLHQAYKNAGIQRTVTNILNNFRGVP